jgi:hypothetical protein
MIDEKTLDQMAKAFAVFEQSGPPTQFMELVRLARLGLWAEKHGVPALENVTALDKAAGDCGAVPASEALAQLPK